MLPVFIKGDPPGEIALPARDSQASELALADKQQREEFPDHSLASGQSSGNRVEAHRASGCSITL